MECTTTFKDYMVEVWTKWPYSITDESSFFFTGVFFLLPQVTNKRLVDYHDEVLG